MHTGPDQDLSLELSTIAHHGPRQTGQLMTRTLTGLHHLRKALGIADIGPEHHPEHPGVTQRELDVSVSRGHQDRMQIRVPKPLVRRSEHVGELIEALTHQSRQDGLTVGEVVVRSLVRTAGTTRDLSHAQCTGARFIEELLAGSQQLGAQVPAAAAP